MKTNDKVVIPCLGEAGTVVNWIYGDLYTIKLDSGLEIIINDGECIVKRPPSLTQRIKKWVMSLLN